MLAEVFLLTAYAVGCDVHSTSLTKAGTVPVVDFTVAADPRILPLGTIINIEGLGIRMVHDIGPAVKGRTIDLFVGDCKTAQEWGRRSRRVRILHTPRGTR